MIWSLFKGRTVPAPAPPQPLHLPRRVDIEEWEPPVAVVQPVEIHIARLITIAYDAGLRGRVQGQEILRLYAEAAWMHGMVPLSNQQILCELGCRVAKSRPKVTTPQGLRQLTHYHLPANSNSRKLVGSSRKRKSAPRRRRARKAMVQSAAMAA